MIEEKPATEEEKTKTKLYFYNCAKCNSDSKDKEKFIVCGVSRRKGMLLRCTNCGHLITRKADTMGGPRLRRKKRTKGYSEEQIDFLKQQFTHTFITRKELTEKFNKKYNTDISYSTLGRLLTKYKILKDKKYYKPIPTFYDDKKLNFLRQQYEHTDITGEELTQMFNAEFETDKTVISIVHTLKRYKILKDKKFQCKVAKKYQRNAQLVYTQKHADFIRKNYTEKPDVRGKEILKLFNKKFGLNISIINLWYIMNRYGLRRQRLGPALIYNHKVKQFIIKCIKEGMMRQECKDACEKEFERCFNITTLGKIANKMGLSFNNHPNKEINKFFEGHKEIEKDRKSVV